MFKSNKRAAVVILVLSATGCAASPGDGTEVERSGTVAQRITTVSPLNRIAGDFNGDGIADALVVTPTEVTEYLGVAGGGFNPGWSDSSITADALLYVGDFNGDGVSDFIVADRAESREYLGFKGTLGGFVGPVWSRSDLTVDSADYVVGDFNGDQVDDVIIATASGSYEYTGIATSGGFVPNVWVRPDLVRGATHYTVGNFNGDGMADLIISNQSGSYEYTGKFYGTFTQNVWTRTDLPYRPPGGGPSTLFTVGNFSNGPDDLIISTPGGSFEYAGQYQGGFVATSWQQTSMTYSNQYTPNIAFTPGYFNGDQFEDVLISTSAGSFEYAGSATVLQYTGYELYGSAFSAGVAYFTAGDFTGDGRSDLILTSPADTIELAGEIGSGFAPGWHSYSLQYPNVFVY